jgi:hypothetical protein
MDNKGKWKSFTISNKINILAQADAHMKHKLKNVTVVTFSVHIEYYCENL